MNTIIRKFKCNTSKMLFTSGYATAHFMMLECLRIDRSFTYPNGSECVLELKVPDEHLKKVNDSWTEVVKYELWHYRDIECVSTLTVTL